MPDNENDNVIRWNFGSRKKLEPELEAEKTDSGVATEQTKTEEETSEEIAISEHPTAAENVRDIFSARRRGQKPEAKEPEGGVGGLDRLGIYPRNAEFGEHSPLWTASRVREIRTMVNGQYSKKIFGDEMVRLLGTQVGGGEPISNEDLLERISNASDSAVMKNPAYYAALCHVYKSRFSF